MQKSGKIIEKNGNEVVVEFKRTSACGNCKACKTFEDASYATIHIKTTSTANIGDTIDISISDKQFVLSSLMFYGLPLIGLIIGALVGTFVANIFEIEPDGFIAFGGAIFFMCMAFFVVRIVKT